MNANGSLSPWRSPDGTPLHIAAAAPYATWSDMVNALMPNGRTFDDQVTSPTADLSPVGVEKQTIDYGLYEEGAIEGYYAAPGVNPQDDVTTWYNDMGDGEPYDTLADRSTIQQIAQFHSPYYLLDGAYEPARRRPRRFSSPTASPTTFSRSMRRCATTTSNVRCTRLTRSACTSRTSATSAPTTSRLTLRCFLPASRRSSTTTSRAPDRSRRWV